MVNHRADFVLSKTVSQNSCFLLNFLKQLTVFRHHLANLLLERCPDVFLVLHNELSFINFILQIGDLVLVFTCLLCFLLLHISDNLLVQQDFSLCLVSLLNKFGDSVKVVLNHFACVNVRNLTIFKFGVQRFVDF